MNVKQFSSDKILQHIDRIHEWRETGISRPITYELDLTNRCNNKCPHCFGFYNRKKNLVSMPYEFANDILHQIKYFGGKAITFTGGGEPLMHPDFCKLAKKAHDLNIDVALITNGNLLNAENIKCILENCTWVRISLDAGTKEVYKERHGMNHESYKKLLEKIRKLCELKKKMKSKTKIGLGYLTPLGENGDVVDFLMLAYLLEIDYVQFRPMLNYFGNKIEQDNKKSATLVEDICNMDSRDISSKKKLHKWDILCSKHKYDKIISGNISKEYGKCYGHNFATVISSTGKMYICCHMRGVEKYCLGDLHKQELQEIWKSERRFEISKRINFNDCPQLCRCDNFNEILWNISKEKEHVNFL